MFRVYNVEVHSVGVFTAGVYGSRTTDFGAVSADTCLGSTLGVYSVGGLQCGGLRCSCHRLRSWLRRYLLLRKNIEDPYSCLVV